MGAMIQRLAATLLCASTTFALPQVVSERNELTNDFRFKHVPPPARNDAATAAEFTLVEGRRDGNGGDLDKLHDGKLPRSEDAPGENFFFAAGSSGGKLRIDLGRTIEIKLVNTFSWHASNRGPQVFVLSAGNNGKDDWKKIAAVDTCPKSGGPGGQYGVSISDSTGTLGRYRYLRFDISCTEKKDPFGNTFFSEIDVIEASGPAPEPVVSPMGRVEIVETEGGQCRLAVDTTDAPDLTDWTHVELAPVLREWYPRIVKLLASEGYAAPRNVQIVFNADMKGVAATGGTRVSCAAQWYRQNLKGEAKGSIVHELVHVVQQYGLSRRNPKATPTPGWVTEGIADYIRWFLYEPQSHGAEISPRTIANARYDASYRTTANFLNFVTAKYDPQLVTRLNAAARAGTYTEDFWRQRTGRILTELADAWKAALTKK
jgi:hypothetical protein